VFERHHIVSESGLAEVVPKMQKEAVFIELTPQLTPAQIRAWGASRRQPIKLFVMM
jgi:hypothetical protein